MGRKIYNGLDLKKLFKVDYSISVPAPDKTEEKICRENFSFKKETRQLIVNACPTDPFSVPLDILNSEKSFNYFIGTLNGLSQKLPVHLVIDYKKKDLIKKIVEKTKNIFIYPVKAIFPQDHPQALLRLVNCSGEDTEIVFFSELLSEEKMIITVSFWSKLNNNRCQLIMDLPPLPFSELWKIIVSRNQEFSMEGTRVITGGLFIGREQTDFSETISPDMSPIVIIPNGERRDFLPNFYRRFIVPKLYTTNTYGEERNCVNCGWCDEICPVNIPVRAIYESILKNRAKEVRRFGLYECIDCGLCTYTCPSKIELMESIRNTKRDLCGKN